MIRYAARPDAVGQQRNRRSVRAGAEVRRAPAGAEDEHEAGGLQRGETDRDVARVLGDLALTDRTLLLEFLQLRDDHAEHLHDDARRDVRHDPEREDREALERSAGEQVQEPEGTLLVGGVTELLDGDRVDARNPDEHTESVDADHGNDEQDLVPKIGDLEDVRQTGKHAGGSLPVLSCGRVGVERSRQ